MPVAMGIAVLSGMAGKVTGILPVLNRDKVREGSASGWWARTDKARAELGYVPEMDLRRGLEDTIRWARDQGKL